MPTKQIGAIENLRIAKRKQIHQNQRKCHWIALGMMDHNPWLVIELGEESEPSSSSTRFDDVDP